MYYYDAAARTLAEYLDQGILACVPSSAVLNINFPNFADLPTHRPQPALVAAEHYYRQILVRVSDGPDRWVVHVEHRERTVDPSRKSFDTDTELLKKTPVMTVLPLGWSPLPIAGEESIQTWLACLSL